MKGKSVGQEKSKNELLVFISRRESTCDECKEMLGHGAWITLNREKGALCLSCGDLDHLLFLPPGDAALTRRARKYSTLAAVVLEWSRARKRYERQGLLVEEQALEKAEQECLADSETRARRREREAAKVAEMDKQYIGQFTARVRECFPRCPAGREMVIAQHACLKYSGRVGRSAAAKSLDEEAVRLAVVAHIRHAETSYDDLLARGHDRQDARAEVRREVDRILSQWTGALDSPRLRSPFLLPFGIRLAEISRRSGLSLSGVSQSVKRGEELASARGYTLIETMKLKK